MTREHGQQGSSRSEEPGASHVEAPSALPAFALEVLRTGDPKRIAELLAEIPSLRTTVLTSLHQTRGAAFVQAVLAQPPQPSTSQVHAGHVAAAGNGPAAASSSPSTAPAQADGPTLGATTPEHDFIGTGDQDALWQRVEPMLSGKAPAIGLGDQVADMDRAHRDLVLQRLSDVAKHADGETVLRVADLVGAKTDVKIKAALAAHPPATARQLRAHLVQVPAGDLVAALDAQTLALLSATYPDPSLVVPQITELSLPVAGNVDMVRWLLKSLSPERLAICMMGALRSVIPTLAKSLNVIGADGWKWVHSLDAGAAALGEDKAKLFADAAPPAVSASLLAVAPSGDIGTKHDKSPDKPSDFTKLVPNGALDMSALNGALATSQEFLFSERGVLKKSPYRERLIAAATFEQLHVLTDLLQVYTNDKFAWLLDSPHVTVEGIRALASSWGSMTVDGALTPANIKKLQTMFPDAGPLDLFGTQTKELYARALTDSQLRRWCTRTADPRQLLELVTQRPDAVSLMWRALIADGIRTDWVHALGAGQDDSALRTLALNCPDRAISTWIKDHLLGDRIAQETASNDVVAIPGIAMERSGQRRLEEGVEHEAASRELGRRTSELTETEAARVRANPDELANVLTSIEEPWVSRALFKLQPTTAAVLRHADVNAVGVATYLRGRPSIETIEALSDPLIASRVFGRVSSPFTRVPALNDPATLAAVLSRNHDVLAWILRTTDARYALEHLGHASVAAAAGAAFSRDALDLLPSTIEMSSAQEASLERLAKNIKSTVVAELLRNRGVTEEDEAEGDPESTSNDASPAKADNELVESRQRRIDLVLQHPDLEGALDAALLGDPDPFVVLAVCRAHAQGALAMFTEPKNVARIDKLRKVVKESPVSVFPQVPYYAFLHSAPARRWLFETEPAPVLLRELTSSDVPLSLLTKPLDTHDFGAHEWVRSLPTGTQLSATEQRAIKVVFDAVKTPAAARAMFGVRFGATAAESYTKTELTRLWGVLERLPPSHAAQAAVTSFHEFDNNGRAAGLYSGSAISLEEGLLTKNETKDGFDQGMTLTREQVMAAYRLDDKQLEARIAQGQFEVKETPEGTRYEIKPQTQALLDNVVLHEVGHGVDDMLGRHNELVYGLAGWREFGESDIPAFAQEFGGWEKVAAADKPRIVEAWQVWFNSTQGDATVGLDAFVGTDHPARSPAYQGVGIVDIARQNKPLDAYNMAPVAGKVPIAHHGYSKLYRVPVTTMHAAPSIYSMTAPAEFFAECYAEYYRAYDGTPRTQDKKGGRLAGWIKEWFDTNIDKLAFNPSRK